MSAALHPLAGKPATAELLIDISKLEREYYTRKPDLADPNQLVSFGTSGHRGSPLNGTFTEAHILAVTQAICDYRRAHDIAGPLFMGKDTHVVSAPAERTVLEVLAANGIETFVQRNDGFTPTPAVSHAIVAYNRTRKDGLADGIVVTPSHNPPSDGGIKYNPPHGGPAETEVTRWIETRANELLKAGNRNVKRVPFESAIRASSTHQFDFISPYVNDLSAVVDTDAIRSARLKIGVDPLGGAALAYWQAIAQRYGLDLTVVNGAVDPTFRFMRVDHDGKIRMDCSSPYAMAGLIELRNRFDIAFGTDPDADRHGVVTRSVGLMNPNHYLAVAIYYLLTRRSAWRTDLAVGKTVVSSSLIDRVVAGLNRQLFEVPVGFKWFATPLLRGSICFGGEESAGATFLRQNSMAWTTDKDGLVMCMLACEITACTGKDPGQLYAELTSQFGMPYYKRIDAPATPEQKAILQKLSPQDIEATELAGESILAKLTHAPGNGAPIGGLKVVTQNAWFAARPSGTENVYKLYAESFKGQCHLEEIIAQAQTIVAKVLSRP